MINFDDFTRSDYISLVATLAAGISAFYTFRYTRLTSELLKLSKKDFSNKQSDFTIYLINNFRFIVNDKGARKLLLFNIKINNKSENKNSFKAVLEIEFKRKDNSISKVLVDHDPKLIELVPNKKLLIFENDIRVEEKHIESKWLIFEQPTSTFIDYRIAKYTIRLTDINEVEQKTEIFLMKDLHDEI